ncbi:CKB_collapsed_G0007850.mRNA.1.CDS.1 [Saccharomyces cerevisiae]|jgi:protein MSS2|nr:Mss2p [Saccharomyces cerevisiae Lalvin QA23]KAF4006835.1 Protein MSS2, mitochondrial domain protein [Saccharomyces cerevisiae]CAI7185529.1 CKB_collapsed_G0007850.mRNA.1.CDS.1 [Saccharomyces cerevisiae]
MSSEPMKAKALLENCASIGFKECFKTLGFLELNYFNNYERAKEWFKTGMEIMDLECFFGFFDCCVKEENFKGARDCLESVKKLGSDNDKKTMINVFLESRKDSIKLLDKARL